MKTLITTKEEKQLQEVLNFNGKYLETLLNNASSILKVYCSTAKEYLKVIEKNKKQRIKDDANNWKMSDKVPISTFPTNGNEDKDTPIVIWEHPLHNCPFGLYTAGVDSYRDAESEDSASLGSVYY